MSAVPVSVAWKRETTSAHLDPSDWTADGSAIAPLKVLVVDDNRDFAESLAFLIRSFGHRVEAAFDGLSAVQRFQDFRPHLILLDIRMPGLDGHEVCRRIRRDWWGAGAAIAAITGTGDETFRRCRRDDGFDFRLVKPIAPRTLEELLAKCCAQR